MLRWPSVHKVPSPPLTVKELLIREEVGGAAGCPARETQFAWLFELTLLSVRGILRLSRRERSEQCVICQFLFFTLQKLVTMIACASVSGFGNDSC